MWPLPRLRIATAQRGQLLITAGNGRQSIDTVTVTVTIGGKAPTHIAASASIQAAINAASPDDMLMIDPTCTSTAGLAVACSATGQTHPNAVHSELLLTGARGTAVTVTFTGTNLTGTFAVTGIGALIR